MRAKGINQQALADGLEVSQPTVSRWLAGLVPRNLAMTGIARFLDVNIEWLRDGIGKQFHFSVFARGIPRSIKNLAEMDDAAIDRAAEEEVEFRHRSVGMRIAILRKNLGMGLREFAARCGCSPSYISKLEGGSRTNLSPDLEEGLMKAFGVSRDWISLGFPPVLKLPNPFPEPEKRFVNILKRMDAEEITKASRDRNSRLGFLVENMKLTNRDLAELIESTRVKAEQNDALRENVAILTKILTDRLRIPDGGTRGKPRGK
jgi:transcriptional regulator with XRE-family HTH domain